MKKTIEDWREEYKKVTGKEPAIRWTKRMLEKRITDAEILQAGYAAKDRATSKPEQSSDINPEFEELASGQEEILNPPRKAGPVGQEDQGPASGRGGPREGAGRPTGQTDMRARCERVMLLEVPDLAVGLAVDSINSGLARLTGVGLDDKPVSSIDLSAFPHGSKSMALGLTRLLYFWFPSLEGRTDVVTLHLEALFMIVNPLRERANRIFSLKKQENEHGKEESRESEANQPGPAAGPAAEPAAGPASEIKSGPAVKRSKAKKNRSHRSHK